ncbi:UDP-N-acetylmuramate dehydrogenase [Paenibacillus pini]|uniref:UDP-N-acetylenolpyruvoylglucosamine reductase n=1 Tax=Paenibacillus pini JCM 16418 TaxID=1236976 RepID=W7YSY5_9BACL|nr:UDP-N-acetylmuramate dehydrogenase [Paenibacillus pini]GAF07751.1 UDP-N-acetylenolpyruvoylglucosamine reductase [Paenibacillus pini JCM 16418]
MTNNSTTFEKLCLRNEPLANHSSYEIGGNANFVAMPETPEELLILLQGCKTHGLDYFFFGMGSNLLFPDKPKKDRLYISLKNYVHWEMKPDKWFIASGTPMSMLSVAGLTYNLPGLEFTYLLPGGLGAGIYMNAKYGPHQINDIIETVYYIDLSDPTLNIRSIPTAECLYGYKQSIFQQNPWIIVGADMVMKPVEPVEGADDLLNRWKKWERASSLPSFYEFMNIEAAALHSKGIIIPSSMTEIDNYRSGKRHFEYPSCGSVFKNNYDYGTAVGALVDRLDMKNIAHGGAMISPFHGNMILNHDHATAEDVKYLMNVIMEAVDKNFGFVPEPEVVVVD